MAKKSKARPDDLLASLEGLSLVEGMFDEICGENKKDFGGDMVFTGAETDKLAICLPVPSFSTRVILGNEGLPLGKHIMIIGEQESFKSALCDEFIRWHRMLVTMPASGSKPARTLKVGKGYKFETEGKQWSDLTNSLLNYDNKAVETFLCGSLDGEDDGWMTALTKCIQHVQERFEPLVVSGSRRGQPREEAMGRIAPACFVVDSVMGALSQSTGDKIEANGAPSMSHAIEANKISNYMKKMPKWGTQWPFTIMGVNHKKVSKTPEGRTIVSLPGGKALKFHESLELDLRRLKEQFNRETVGEEGVRIAISVTKNSNGPWPREPVEVEVLWWHDPNHLTELGQPRQVTIFDWHSATVEELAKYTGKFGNQIKEIIDLQVIENTRRVWSKALGIPEKSPVRYREAGAMLEERPDLLYPLYNLYGIHRRCLFQPGIDFRKQLDALRAQNDLEKKAKAKKSQEAQEAQEEAAQEELLNQPVADPFG